MHGEELQSAVSAYVEQYAVLQNLQPKTRKNRRNAMNRLMDFLRGRPFSLQTTNEYISHLISHEWKPSSIRAEIKVIKAFGAYLHEQELIPANFTKKVRGPKVHNRMREFISEEEAERAIYAGTAYGKSDNSFAKHIKAEMQIGMRFILRTGIRISEAIGISGADLHLDAEIPIFFVTSKGGDYEPLPIPPDMIDELRKRKKRKRVFEISADGCNRALQRGCTALGLVKQTVHDLRHIYSLRRLRAGESYQLVSRTLRHSSVAITDKYYSHYVLSDLVPVAFNSSVIRSGTPSEFLFDRVTKAVNRTGVDRDKRIIINQVKSENELVIRVSLKDGGER